MKLHPGYVDVAGDEMRAAVEEHVCLEAGYERNLDAEWDGGAEEASHRNVNDASEDEISVKEIEDVMRAALRNVSDMGSSEGDEKMFPGIKRVLRTVWDLSMATT